jgi:hypothetical protein
VKLAKFEICVSQRKLAPGHPLTLKLPSAPTVQSGVAFCSENDGASEKIWRPLHFPLKIFGFGRGGDGPLGFSAGHSTAYKKCQLFFDRTSPDYLCTLAVF